MRDCPVGRGPEVLTATGTRELVVVLLPNCHGRWSQQNAFAVRHGTRVVEPRR